MVSEGEEWKKHRRVVAAVFSEVRPERRSSSNPEYDCQRDNKLVLDETIRIIIILLNQKINGTCSTVSGATIPKLLWITVLISLFWYVSYRSYFTHGLTCLPEIAPSVISAAGSLFPVPTVVLL